MPDTSFSNGYALLIGVGADLPVTMQDARALRDLLIDPRRAAYPPDQVELLVAATATRQSILEAFDRLTQRTASVPNATIIVYFSGHGGKIERSAQTSEYFLVPFGYDPANRTETAISDREFTDCIRPLNARKLVVLLDCCHAGGVPALKEVGEAFVKSPIPPDLLNILDTGSGRIVIASSREGESSYTGNPYSVFTACLLEALKGKGTIYPDGYSRILDVLAYLFRTVPGRTQDQQHPYVRRVLDLGDNFPLCYYAASSKQVPEGASLETHLPTISTFTTYSRSQILQKLNALRAEWDLRMEKLRRIRSRIAIETDISVSFKLEHQALDEEAAMAALEAQMRELERAAQDA